MNIRDQLEQKLGRFEELERIDVPISAILADSTKMANCAREHGGTQQTSHKYRTYKKMSDDIKDLKAMAESPDPKNGIWP
jgi:protein subunit release factor A